jgi:hypothetical protein
MIQSYNISIQAGANMIAEQVSFMFDRLMPWTEYKLITAENMPKGTLDAIVGFTDTTEGDAAAEDISSGVTSSSI